MGQSGSVQAEVESADAAEQRTDIQRDPLRSAYLYEAPSALTAVRVHGATLSGQLRAESAQWAHDAFCPRSGRRRLGCVRDCGDAVASIGYSPIPAIFTATSSAVTRP